MLNIELLVEAPAWREVKDLENLIERAGTAAMEAARSEPAPNAQQAFEVAINLSDDARIQTLNQQFRSQDKPTNVLSFPFEEDFPELATGPLMLGDLMLAHETIWREALEQNKVLEHHISHLVVHGVLHLLGFDHIEEQEAEEMEGLEIDILE
ncbi:MAG: rRNA maturation RNase YbeY, partial [Hyphomicrobiaceae bacterium]|nr:rRNA maturation RNase YbeY [Hyphomicrobiaceae bacterium]